MYGSSGEPDTAASYLQQAVCLLAERGKEYDSGEERSMGKTVQAFNAVAGRDLTESEGWLLMLLLKQVRQFNQPGLHSDSAKDGVAYAALLAESLAQSDGVGSKENGKVLSD